MQITFPIFYYVKEAFLIISAQSGFYPNIDEEFANPFENIVKSEYTKILFSFLNNILGADVQYQDIKSRIFYVIVNKIANCCENKACDLLEKIDKKLLMKIYDFFFKYKDIFHF